MTENKAVPSLTIIIPTYTSSAYFLENTLKAIYSQDYPSEKLEVIVVDNESKDATVDIARRHGAAVISHHGKPPQVCDQRNIGANAGRGEYLYFLDHDMELSPGLLLEFSRAVSDGGQQVDAWYVPENICSKNMLWKKIRNFERQFYNATVVDAARIIKKETFLKTQQYDTVLSGGPADWDFDNQLKELKAKFGIIKKEVYHHEEAVTLVRYLRKKGGYVGGADYYKEKWKVRNKRIYETVVCRQFGLFYRMIWVFFEKGKWKTALSQSDVFLMMILLRLLVGFLYVFKKTIAKS